MKKPKITSDNKGLILAILWLLIENPTNLDYLTASDIVNLLQSEFNRNISIHTATSYLNALTEFELDVKVKHTVNKGYFVEKDYAGTKSREILLNSIRTQSIFDEYFMSEMINIIGAFSSRATKKRYYKLLCEWETSSSKSDLRKVLAAINTAIMYEKQIRFDYETYYYKAGLKTRYISYKVTPEKIRYLDGTYYLMTNEEVWPDMYYGIPISYIHNVEILESDYKINLATLEYGKYYKEASLEYKDYSVILGINYDYAIEFIYRNFFKSNIEITRYNGQVVAKIKAPFYKICNFCLIYRNYFTVTDRYINSWLDSVWKEKLLYPKNDDLAQVIKSAIVNYFYSTDIDIVNYSTYMNRMKKYVDNKFLDLGYKIVDEETLSLNNEMISYRILTYNSKLLDKKGDINDILTAINFLQTEKNNRCYLVLLYDDLGDYEKAKINQIVRTNMTNSPINCFSVCTKAYYHNFDVFRI